MRLAPYAPGLADIGGVAVAAMAKQPYAAEEKRTHGKPRFYIELLTGHGRREIKMITLYRKIPTLYTLPARNAMGDITD